MKVFGVSIVVMLVVVSGYARDVWKVIGQDMFTKENASRFTLVVSPQGQPYVIYEKIMDNPENLATQVLSWTENGWTKMAPLSTKKDSHYCAAAIDSKGTPYLAFTGDDGQDFSIYRWNQCQWEELGPRGSLKGNPTQLSIAFDPNGDMYVAYQDLDQQGQIVTLRWTGKVWQSIPSIGLSDDVKNMALSVREVDKPTIALINHKGYAVVKKWTGSVWENIVQPAYLGTSAFYQVGMDNTGKPMVYQEDRPQYGYQKNIKVLENSQWKAIGSTSLKVRNSHAFAVSQTRQVYVVYPENEYTAYKGSIFVSE